MDGIKKYVSLTLGILLLIQFCCLIVSAEGNAVVFTGDKVKVLVNMKDKRGFSITDANVTLVAIDSNGEETQDMITPAQDEENPELEPGKTNSDGQAYFDLEVHSSQDFILVATAALNGIPLPGEVRQSITVGMILAAPTIEPAAGQYNDSVTVTLIPDPSNPQETEIYYTTDGSDPTSESNLYSAPFTISSTTPQAITVKAIAICPPHKASDVVSAVYDIVPTLPQPQITPSSRSINPRDPEFENGILVQFSIPNEPEGVEYYYSLDGSEPSIKAQDKQVLVPLGEDGTSITVKVLARCPGYNDSPIATATYEFVDAVVLPDPQFNPVGGTYYDFVEIEIINSSPPDANSVVYYTLDGTDPDENSLLYTGPIVIRETTTLKAIVLTNTQGYLNSGITSMTYVVIPVLSTPIITPNGGIIDNNLVEVTISLDNAPDNAKIYYTLDGSEPSEQSQEYSGPITIEPTLAWKITLKAKAFCEGYRESETATAEFHFTQPTKLLDRVVFMQNPLNAGEETEIRLTLLENSQVTLYIWNERRTRILFEKTVNLDFGAAKLEWDGTDNKGRFLPQGLYYYQIVAKSLTSNKESKVGGLVYIKR